MDEIILHLTGSSLPHRLGWCSYRKEFAPSMGANSSMQEYYPKSVDLSGFHSSTKFQSITCSFTCFSLLLIYIKISESCVSKISL